ncbi:MAG: phage antirepressor KilAC domain-containing protein [Cyclobacteriaceae bacterium]
MNDLILSGSTIKMTTLDLELIVSKRHADIMKDVRKEIEGLGELAEGVFSLGFYIDKNGQKRPCYEFSKKGAMQLALKYDSITRYRVIEHIESLESKLMYRSPQSMSEALFLAANQAKQLEIQQKLIIDQTPKAEFYDMVAKSDKWITLKQVSDILNIPNVGRNNLCKRLRDEDFFTKYNQPYQKYKNQGLFKSIESVSKTGRVSVSTVVSQKGLIKIRMILLNPKSRNTAAYRKWKKEVFENDLYTCQKCGYTGKEIEPHHIIPWSKSVNKRFDVSNGQTLCKDCHKLEHKANGL